MRRQLGWEVPGDAGRKKKKKKEEKNLGGENGEKRRKKKNRNGSFLSTLSGRSSRLFFSENESTPAFW